MNIFQMLLIILVVTALYPGTCQETCLEPLYRDVFIHHKLLPDSAYDPERIKGNVRDALGIEFIDGREFTRRLSVFPQHHDPEDERSIIPVPRGPSTYLKRLSAHRHFRL